MLLPDGSNVNHTLIRDGWCWWYRKYVPGDAVLEQLEKAAREAKKGLWADPQSVPPWVYRKARRGQTLDLSDFVQLENESEGSGTSRGPPQLGAVEPKSSPDSTSSPYPVIGNRKSHNYHRPDCPNYSQVAPHNRVAFNSVAEAEVAGGIGRQGIVPADETSKVNVVHYSMHMRMHILRYNYFPPNPCFVVRIPLQYVGRIFGLAFFQSTDTEHQRLGQMINDLDGRGLEGEWKSEGEKCDLDDRQADEAGVVLVQV